MDKKALFWSFFVAFCAFCASLCLIKHLFSRLKTSAISVNPVILSNYFRVLRVLRGEKIREISVNPWLINDLRSTKDYVRKNKLFMQNKANFQKVKFDVNRVLTKDYDRMDTWSIRKTKPIQSQLKPIKANSKPIKANIMPKQTQTNPISEPISAAAKFLVCLSGLFCIILLLGVLLIPGALEFIAVNGLPPSLPIYWIIISYTPWLCAVVVVPILFLNIIAWIKKYWTIVERLHFGLVSITLIIFIWLSFTLNMVPGFS